MAKILSHINEPIKILHVVDSLQPGGMENGIVNVASRLDPNEFDIHVACLSQRGEFAERLPRPEQVASLDKVPGFSTETVRGLGKLIKKIRPQVLHSHNLGALIYGALASRWGRWIPVLHGEHGQLDKHHLTRKRLWQRRCLYRACVKVHTVSDSLRQDLLGHGFSADKIVAVTNGVDTDRFRPAKDKILARQSLNLGLTEQAVVLGMVGRFSEFKGHDLLLDAFERLCESGRDYHLLLIGAGGSEEQRVLKQVKKSSQRKQIHVLGHQEQPECFYQAMDLMVFPSSHEGLSNAVLESMACGIPVLGSDACGNNEAIINGENGFLESFASPMDLTNVMRRLLTDEKKLMMAGQKARQYMLDRFSIDSMVEGYQKLYGSVILT